MNRYIHGGDVISFAKIAGCAPHEVLDLSSNINFVTPDIDDVFHALDPAPYPSYDALYTAIAARYGVTKNMVEIFNGASQAIMSLFIHLKMTQHTHAVPHVTFYTPAYLEYKRAAGIFGYTASHINRFNAMDTPPRDGSLIVFANPATPDGIYYDPEPFLEMWHARGCTVLIDESFLEFTPHSSAAAWLHRYPRLYILKSMTKYYGAAGVRIGVLLARQEKIAAVQQREAAWKISAYDQAYMLAALRDDTFDQRSRTQNQMAKSALMDVLHNAPWIQNVYPSDANFILTALQGLTASEFQTRLLPHRIMVRDCSNFDGLGPRHVRIAVKSREAVQQFREALHA